MVDYSHRLKLAMNAANLSTQQLANALGITYQGVRKVLQGGKFGIENNAAAAQLLRVDSDWLATGKGPQNAHTLLQPLDGLIDGTHLNDNHPQVRENSHPYQHSSRRVSVLDNGDLAGDNYIQIMESEVRFSAGNGRQPVFDELMDSVPATYRREWFVKEGINPERARRFKVHGDSMEPFLYDGDTVLVHLTETDINNGKVYALRYGDELKIKRVYKKLDGGLILHSDNPEFLPRDEEISPQVVQEHIAIIGRVRDKSGTGGL